jgi:hypothetical protein
MGGGLFGTGLAANPKCLVASALVIGVYFLPRPFAWQHRVIMAFLIGFSVYIAVAYYDLIYDCNDRLKPTLLGYLSQWFKPREYGEELNNLPLKDYKIIRTVDIAVLIVLVITAIYPFVFRKKSFPAIPYPITL